jgi:hypothetical protein
MNAERRSLAASGTLMLRRLALPFLVFLLLTGGADAADDVPKQTPPSPGTCFTYAVTDSPGIEKDPASAVVSRIDIQPLQFKVEKKPLPETRIRIGVLTRTQNTSIPNDISAPCTGEGLAFNCTMKCADKIIGKFRAEALPTRPNEPKASYLRLIIETPTVLNGCSEGKEPFTVPKELIGLQIILRGAEPTACFK